MITEKEYLSLKADTDHIYPTDRWYIDFANHLLSLWQESGEMQHISPHDMKQACLCLTGYMIDISGDFGMWRSFIGHCRKLYGFPVPFYTDPLQDEITETGNPDHNYVDFELNEADIRFLLWYALSFADKKGANIIYPFHESLLRLAQMLHSYMEQVYTDSPLPEGMILTNELDIYDPDDVKTIGVLAHWMFFHSFLLVPAFRSNMEAIISSCQGKNTDEIGKKLEEAENTVPTGPLALYLQEWLWILLRGELPREKKKKDAPEEHPWYKPFLKASDGKEIMYFDNYKSMNQFLGKALSWDPEADNLPALKNARNFTLLVNKHKGMLIARDVAQLIADPLNPFYSPDDARAQAFGLLINRGLCPIDLISYLLKHHLLPDLQWPGQSNQSHNLVSTNADFLARCYLLQYYRAV